MVKPPNLSAPNIPIAVRVGGRTYRVNVVDRPVLTEGNRGTPLYGRIDFNNSEITVSSFGFSEDTMYLTFLHELIHALTHDRGIEWGDKDEEYTDALARALHAFIVDNNVMIGGPAL